MVEPLTIGAGLGARLAAALAAPLGAKLKTSVLGTDEKRALERVSRQAVQEVAQHFASDVNQADLAHVLALFDEMLATAGHRGLPLPGVGDDAAVIAAWSESAHAAGVDVQTLLVPFGAFLEALLVVLARMLRDEASKSKSPLFRELAMGDLEHLRREAITLRATMVPLAATLEAALESSYTACRATDTRFYTPHLLLVLLDLPDGVVRACFDQVERGLSVTMRDQLARYVARPSGQPFVAFRWHERDDVRSAQRLAVESGSPVVTAPLLLVAVLDTESRTAQQLRARLGTQGVDDLRVHALSARALASPSATPGVIFGDATS
jgi:hypothetical protein